MKEMGLSCEPCWGHIIIPSLLKRICPQIKRVVEGSKQPNWRFHQDQK